MDADLDTLATALYVRIDELVKAAPHQHRHVPRSGSPLGSPTPK